MFMVTDLQSQLKFSELYRQICRAWAACVPQLRTWKTGLWMKTSEKSTQITGNWCSLCPSLPPNLPAVNTEWVSAAQTYLALSLARLCKTSNMKEYHSNTLISTPLKDRIYCCHASTNFRNAELDQWRQNWPRFIVYNQPACYPGIG